MQLQKTVTLSQRIMRDRTEYNHSRPHRTKSGAATRPSSAWHDAWIESGLALNVKRPRQCILPPLPSSGQPARPPNAWAMPPPDPIPTDTLSVYTDGSGPERDETNPTAGWGYTVVMGGDGQADDDAVETHSRCGKVATDAKHAEYMGAQRATNNTAELTAVARWPARSSTS